MDENVDWCSGANCFVKGCAKNPTFQRWARHHNESNVPTGIIDLVSVCEEHKDHPWLCAKSEWDEILEDEQDDV